MSLLRATRPWGHEDIGTYKDMGTYEDMGTHLAMGTHQGAGTHLDMEAFMARAG